MTIPYRLVLSSICLSLALGTSIAAQDGAPPPGGTAEREIDRAVRVLSEQNGLGSDQTRELERAARLQRAAREIQRRAQQLKAEQGRGAARTGGPGISDFSTPGQLGGPVITGAPFSADVATTVTQTLGDGTRLDQRVTGRLVRDGTGRIRREQTILGLDAVDAAERARTLITIDSVPGDSMPYVLDPVARTARRAPRGLGAYFNTGATVTATRSWLRFPLEPAPANAPELARAADRLAEARTLSAQRDALGLPAGGPIPPDIQPTEEQLGQRQVEGVLASGRRTTIIIPTDRIGNDRPIQIVDEHWYSPQLNVIVSSRFSDPRTGVIEYRLTNITRAEPRADLFTVPADYTVLGGPAQ